MSHHTSKMMVHLKLSLILLALLYYTPLTSAYVTSGLPAHTHRAFLHKITDEICNTDPGSLTLQDVEQSAKVMEAWASTPPEKFNESGKDRAIKVESLLNRIIDERRAGNDNAVITTEHYNALMKSWTVSGERRGAAASRVQQILLAMQQQYTDGDENVQPNLTSFEIAIEAWVRATDEPAATARAQHILDYMTNIYLSDANDQAKPHTSCFHPILKSLAASGNNSDAPISCEHIIQWMQYLQRENGIDTVGPDTMCFNILMSSWLKSKDVNAEHHIMEVFDYMNKAQQLGSQDIKPDSSSYNIVISSIAPGVLRLKQHNDMNGARRADEILQRLERGCLGGDTELRPDTIIYNQVIDYWAKTQSDPSHFLKAREVLDRQIEMYKTGGVRKCRPDLVGYTSVIAACASTPLTSSVSRQRSFDLAHLTFMECCKLKYMQPNDVTYGVMLKAVGRLLKKQEDRDRYAKTLFLLCCSEGYLGEMAYNRMKYAVSKSMLHELTNGRRYDELPKEWRRNVKRKQSQLDGGSSNSKRSTTSQKKQASVGGGSKKKMSSKKSKNRLHP